MKRKKLNHLSFIAGCLLLCGALNGQSYAHMQHDVRLVDSKPIVTGTMYAQKNLGKKLGINSFALITQGWGEILIGPYFRINNSVSIGLQVGMETLNPYLRFGGSFTYFGSKTNCLVFLEKGKGDTNYWYSAALNYQPKVLIYGLLAQRFYGIGPTFGYPINDLTIRLAPLYDLETQELHPTLFFKWVL